MKTARFWRAGDHGEVECRLCPHRCRIPEGGRSRCYGRVNHGGVLMAETWGQPVAMGVDPIEKKPLYHFLPARSVLSLGTLGCNLSCRFCQNWSLSHPDLARTGRRTPVQPGEVARTAAQREISMVAATYNEPVVWAEYALEIADACHEENIRMVAVTSGYISPEARGEFFGKMDAVNVDLKSMREDFYRTLCGAHLAPVLETLEFIRRETACWLEVTTLLIPGVNDSDTEISELTGWVAEHLGVDTPLHFSAFHPDGEMRDVQPTPAETLRRARARARAAGLRHVYVGNVRGPADWAATACPECGARLVERNGYDVQVTGMAEPGRCSACGSPCAGVWA